MIRLVFFFFYITNVIYLCFSVHVKYWVQWMCHGIQLHIRPLTWTPRPICFAPPLLWRQSQHREQSIRRWLCSLKETLLICNILQTDGTRCFTEVTHINEKRVRVFLSRSFLGTCSEGCWSLSHLNMNNCGSLSVKTGCTHKLALRRIAGKAKVCFLLQKQKTSQTEIQT